MRIYTKHVTGFARCFSPEFKYCVQFLPKNELSEIISNWACLCMGYLFYLLFYSIINTSKMGQRGKEAQIQLSLSIKIYFVHIIIANEVRAKDLYTLNRKICFMGDLKRL